MPKVPIEFVVSNSMFERLPLHIDQKPSRTSVLVALVFLVPAVVMMLAPVGLLAAFGTPALWAATTNPIAAAQVAGGLGVWIALFVIPATRVVQRLGVAREILISQGAVTVRSSGALRTRVWSAPLADFSGIAHHVRSTLSGVRHEVILVHRQRHRSLLLHVGDQVPHTVVERAMDLLGLPHVSASELYRFGSGRVKEATPLAPTALPKPMAA